MISNNRKQSHQVNCKRWLLVVSGYAVTFLASTTTAFVSRPRPFESSRLGSRSDVVQAVVALSSEAPPKVDAFSSSSSSTASAKPTGSSFLPPETLQRAKQGSPIEKIKLEKDGTAAFVDVYEYARKIRNGEMTWEEVEKADLDSVCLCVAKFCCSWY